MMVQEQKVKVLDYEPLEKSVARVVEGKVIYGAKPDWTCRSETKVTVTLFYDEGSSTWLAGVRGQFLEGYSEGEQVFLDSSHGPFKLNLSACKKLAEAYQIDSSRLDLSAINNMAPSQLEKLATPSN